MQLFDDKLIQDTIRSIHVPYQFNMYEDNPFTLDAVISNGAFSSNSTFHIHSLKSFQCGDYTKIKEDSNNVYMVTSDVLEMRGGKYKATLEHCNYSIEVWEEQQVFIGYDKLGRPVYETQLVKSGELPSILRYKDMSYSTNDAINLTKSYYEITIRNNDAAKTYFGLDEGIYNDVTIYDVSHRIINVDYSRVGLIRVNLEKR